MTKNGLSSEDRARLKAELEARRTALRVEVKTQLAGSGDEGVVGLRNRIQESGDEWGVADGLAELDLVKCGMRSRTSRKWIPRSPDARWVVRRMCRLRRADRRAAHGYPRAALRSLPGRLRAQAERSSAHRRLAPCARSATQSKNQIPEP